ncbi:E3 ubiquitin-protein ligase TRIM21-like [Gastrophryne carolinensis]
MASADLRKELDCSVCQRIYTDPVTLRCGHNFCRECIYSVLDTQEGSEAFYCPECRAEFLERPAPIMNITLRNIVGNYLSTHPDLQESGIFCTYCVDGSPVPAVKSCLQCEASLCDKHLRVHSKSPEHVLTDPTASMQNKKCPIHKRILEYYCPKDAACICVSCSLAGDHRGHQVEMLEEASQRKKKKLKHDLEEFTKDQEHFEKRIQSLQEHETEVPGKVADCTKRVNAFFGDHRRQLDDLEKRVLSEITRLEGQTSLSLTALIKQITGDKDDLSRRMCHMEELCNTTDPLTVLQDSEAGDPEKADKEDRDKPAKVAVDDYRGGLDKDSVSKILHTGFYDLTKRATVSFYMEEPAHLLLDVGTAQNQVCLSEDMKTASFSGHSMYCSGTSERFQTYPQVLSIKSFNTGRHYWDLEIEGAETWRVGMSYTSIDRTGDQSMIGCNNKSWCLQMKNKLYAMIHDSKSIPLHHNISSHRFRVYLDYEAGQMSFYELSSPIRHLHTFTTTFTEPLHAMLGIWNWGCIKTL